MVGPFFYINDKSLGYKGILYKVVPEEESENCMTSPHGHSDLFDTTFGQTSADYFQYQEVESFMM